MASTAHTYEKYKGGYEQLLANVVIKTSWKGSIDRVAKQIVANKNKYLEVQDAIGVPWEFVGVVHSLECGLSFSGHLHNGNSLKKRTYEVPKGYPKAKPANGVEYTWLESALDALKLKGLQNIKDWNESRVAYELERYNGFGYRSTGINSPYLWSGSNHYTRGKYVADHKYDANHVSQQTGAMLLYLQLTREPQSGTVGKPTTTKELKKKSTSFWIVRNVRDFFRWAATAIVGLFTMDFWGVAKDFMTTLKDFAFSPTGIFTVGGVLILAWLVFEYLDRHRLAKQKEHENVNPPDAP